MVAAVATRVEQDMVYSFKAGAHIPAGVEADEVHDELCSIQERRGQVTADTVAEDVESVGEAHPLAWGFTFDVGTGMHKLHVIEAGRIIRSVVVTNLAPEQTEPVRAWVVTREEGEKAQYDQTDVVVRQVDLRKQLIEQVDKEYAAAERKRRELMTLIRLL